MSYPKWVSRGYGMGEILCLNADDEAAVDAERAEREKPAEAAVAQPHDATDTDEVGPARKKPGPKPKAKE